MAWLRKTSGIVLIILGVIGLFLPFLQGILLIIAGVYLLKFEPVNRWIESIIKKLKKWKTGGKG